MVCTSRNVFAMASLSTWLLSAFTAFSMGAGGAEGVEWLKEYFAKAEHGRRSIPSAEQLLASPSDVLAAADSNVHSESADVAGAARLLYWYLLRSTQEDLIKRECAARLVAMMAVIVESDFRDDDAKMQALREFVGCSMECASEHFDDGARQKLLRIAERWPVQNTIRLLGIAQVTEAVPWLGEQLETKNGWHARLTRVKLGVMEDEASVLEELRDKALANERINDRATVARDLLFLRSPGARDLLVELALAVDDVYNEGTVHPEIHHAGYFLGALVEFLPEMPKPEFSNEVNLETFIYNGPSVEEALRWLRSREGAVEK